MNEFEEHEKRQETEEETAKEFWGKRREIIETDEAVKEGLEKLGVENVELTGLQEKFQKEILTNLESMVEHYPEIEGYVSSIRSAKLPQGIMACSGPRYTENGYAGAELQFNSEFFGKKGYGLEIVDMEMERNWRGETWLAGKGAEGVIAHEMGHVLALRLNAKHVGLSIGEADKEKYRQLQVEYDRNYEINGLCFGSLKELSMNPNDLGRELSTYGASDFGEAFAECISECETRKKPRLYAQTVVNNYRKILEKDEEVA